MSKALFALVIGRIRPSMLQTFNSKTLSLLASMIASSGSNNRSILCQFDSDVMVRTNNNSRMTISMIIITRKPGHES